MINSNVSVITKKSFIKPPLCQPDWYVHGNFKLNEINKPLLVFVRIVLEMSEVSYVIDPLVFMNAECIWNYICQ